MLQTGIEGFVSRMITQEQVSLHVMENRIRPDNWPSLVFLHGSTMDAMMFEGQAKHFAKKFHCVLCDLPGHGKSSKDIELTAKLLRHSVLQLVDELEIGNAVLVGQSLGGMIAQQIVFERDKRISGLVLVASPPVSAPPYRWLKPVITISDWAARVSPTGFLANFIAWSAGSKKQTRSFIRSRVRQFPRKLFPSLLKTISSMTEPGPYPDPKIPVLLINGKKDWLLAGFGNRLSRNWALEKKLSHHVLDGASHNANMDAPQETNRLINGFLEKILKPI